MPSASHPTGRSPSTRCSSSSSLPQSAAALSFASRWRVAPQGQRRSRPRPSARAPRTRRPTRHHHHALHPLLLLHLALPARLRARLRLQRHGHLHARLRLRLQRHRVRRRLAARLRRDLRGPGLRGRPVGRRRRGGQLEHTAVWLARCSPHACDSPTASPYRSRGRDAFAAPETELEDESTAPPAQGVPGPRPRTRHLQGRAPPPLLVADTHAHDIVDAVTDVLLSLAPGDATRASTVHLRDRPTRRS